jgi:hypothetical protein
MEAAMVAAENSGIKDKAKLKEFLYKNPDKLAMKLAKMIQNNDGTLLEPVRIKGTGIGYYYSYRDKAFIPVPRNSEYYLTPWAADDPDECFIYSHHNWFVGIILKIRRDEIEFVGFN